MVVPAVLAAAALTSPLAMLNQWTPKTGPALRAADPVAVAYQAKAWALAGDPVRANMLLDDLAARGDDAYTAGRLPNLVSGVLNPASTVYTIALVQVADAFRAAGRTRDLARAVTKLRSIPIISGGCYAYSVPDAAVGCIQDIGGISLAVTSHIPGFDYRAMLEYEQRTMLPDGSYYSWQDKQTIGIEDAAHLAWTAFMLLGSPDVAVRDLGWRAARFVSATYNPATAPAFSIYAVAAVRIQAGLPGGCELADRLPGWADSYHQTLPDGSVTVKNQMWAAYVYTWSRRYCPNPDGFYISATVRSD